MDFSEIVKEIFGEKEKHFEEHIRRKLNYAQHYEYWETDVFIDSLKDAAIELRDKTIKAHRDEMEINQRDQKDSEKQLNNLDGTAQTRSQTYELFGRSRGLSPEEFFIEEEKHFLQLLIKDENQIKKQIKEDERRFDLLLSAINQVAAPGSDKASKYAAEIDEIKRHPAFKKAIKGCFIKKNDQSYEWPGSKPLQAYFCQQMSYDLDLQAGETSKGTQYVSWQPFNIIFAETHHRGIGRHRADWLKAEKQKMGDHDFVFYPNGAEIIDKLFES